MIACPFTLIKTTERLPKEDRIVLVSYDGENFFTAKRVVLDSSFDYVASIWLDASNASIADPTYWVDDEDEEEN